MSLEVYLDDTPGEVRGVVARGGQFEHLLIQREDDVPEHRLGARCIGRIVDVHPGLKGGFVDLGPVVHGFLPFRGQDRLTVGQKVEVEVSAEPRVGKGPTLRLIGTGEGEPRLLTPGPTVAEILARLAPGVTPVTGAAAIQASRDAEEEAGWPGELFMDTGLDLRVERTRALIAVDLDLSPAPGVAFGAAARTRANRQGLHASARIAGSSARFMRTGASRIGAPKGFMQSITLRPLHPQAKNKPNFYLYTYFFYRPPFITDQGQSTHLRYLNTYGYLYIRG